MKRFYSIAASAVLILWSTGALKAAPSDEPRKTFQQIDALSSRISEEAYHLETMARTEHVISSHVEGLDILKEDVNRIEEDLRALNAERNLLSEWETKALDQISPLMHTVTVKTEEAIRAFNADSPRLSTSPYVEDTDTVFKDAGSVKTILHDYLKLAKVREKEHRLQQNLTETASGL